MNGKVNAPGNNKPAPSKAVSFTAPLPKEVAATFFRYLFSKENSLIELFPSPIVIRQKDIEELNQQITQKICHYDVHGASFDAVASYENQKSEQYGSWERFLHDDWSTPDVLDQLLLNWRFMIKFPGNDKPASYVVSIRLSSALKPQHLMQALFSKNPEDVDNIEMELVPMCCRVDFVDPLLSQELMNIVSQWNKGRPTPECIVPFMKIVKKHSDHICSFLKYSIPIISVSACAAFYWTKTHALDLSMPASTAIIVNSIMWLAGTGAVLFITAAIGYIISEYVDKQLSRFGSFTIFNLTKGDAIRQSNLMARSNISFWKFMFSGGVAVLWNIVAAVLCGILIHN